MQGRKLQPSVAGQSYHSLGTLETATVGAFILASTMRLGLTHTFNFYILQRERTREKMDEFSLTARQRKTSKKREKKKRRQQAKGTPAAHPPPTHPGHLSSAAVLRESESSSDDEEPNKAETENTRPEDSTIAEDVESLALDAPDMLPETTSKPCLLYTSPSPRD